MIVSYREYRNGVETALRATLDCGAEISSGRESGSDKKNISFCMKSLRHMGQIRHSHESETLSWRQQLGSKKGEAIDR